MNTTVVKDEIHNGTQESPGLQLARIREKKGYSQEYVAGKLHLRVRIIELLEADDYEQMPEPVFIKGYLRAYAKLLGVPSESLLEIFNNNYSTERKLEKALWQSRRESNKGEWVVRLLTSLIVVGAVVVVSFWWQKNKDNQQLISAKSVEVVAEQSPSKLESEIRLTDLSKMQTILNPTTTAQQTSLMEIKNGG
jgi:cytoskeleton protein RodZ